MVKKLNFNDNDFNISFRSLIRARKSVPKEVDKKVSNIIADVRTGGDASLRLLTAKYDGF